MPRTDMRCLRWGSMENVLPLEIREDCGHRNIDGLYLEIGSNQRLWESVQHAVWSLRACVVQKIIL